MVGDKLSIVDLYLWNMALWCAWRIACQRPRRRCHLAESKPPLVFSSTRKSPPRRLLSRRIRPFHIDMTPFGELQRYLNEISEMDEVKEAEAKWNLLIGTRRSKTSAHYVEPEEHDGGVATPGK